jgi:hypothetical protein
MADGWSFIGQIAWEETITGQRSAACEMRLGDSTEIELRLWVDDEDGGRWRDQVAA